MRFATWFLFFLAVLLGGALIWLYAFMYMPSVSALRDLEAENERLLAMARPGAPESSAPSDSGEGMRVVYPTDRLFQPGSALLSDEGQSTLKELVPDLKNQGYNAIVVACYTDSTPVVTNTDRFPSNWELAACRASAVVRFLVDQGISPSVLSAVSYGPTRPVASNASPEGRAQNRRIEIRTR